MFGISLLSLAGVLNAVLAFGTQVILVRALDPAEMGKFAAALGTITLIAPIAGFGVGQYWLRKFSEDQDAARQILLPSYSLIGTMTVITLAMLLIWSNLQGGNDGMTDLLRILSVCVLGHVSIELLSAKFQHEGQMTKLAAISLTQNALRFSFVGFLTLATWSQTSIYSFAICFAMSALMIVLIAVVSLRKLGGASAWVRLPDNQPRQNTGVRQIARASFPFGAALLLQLLYYQSDVVMLKYLSGPEQAGFYNVAFTLVAATYILPTAVFQRYFLPKIHIWAFRDPERLRMFFLFGSIAIGVASLLVVVVIWCLSDFLIVGVFGSDYAASAPILRVLLLSIPAIYVSYNFGTILMTRENMAKKTAILAVVAFFNIVMNVIFIPKMGGMGAALTTVASAYILLLLYALAAVRALKHTTGT